MQALPLEYPTQTLHRTSRHWLHVYSLHSVRATLESWFQRARQRRQLLSLSDRMLKDIGISRADAVAEGEKPFWRT